MNLFKYLKEKEVYQKNRIFQNLRNCLLNSQSQRRVSDSSRQPNRNAWIFILGTAICVIGCLSYYCCVTNHPRLCAKKNHHYIMFMDSRRSRHQGNGLSLFLDVWGLKWLGSWGERNLFQDCFFLHTSSMLAGMTKRWGGFTGTAGQSAYAQAHGHGSPKRVRLFTRQCSVWGWGEVHRGNVQRMILPKIWVEVE